MTPAQREYLRASRVCQHIRQEIAEGFNGKPEDVTDDVFLWMVSIIPELLIRALEAVPADSVVIEGELA